jgi:hypothetical protein
LWGLDIQLEGYIDQAQVDFFAHVARRWMPPESNLILCTGQPDWVYVDPKEPKASAFRNFSFMESLAETAHRGNRLRLVLTGDSHHYSRYTERDVQYITAGGGGAFLHPTHQLEDKYFDWDYPPPGVASTPGQKYRREFKIAKQQNSHEPALFPSTAVSRRLALRNIAFPILNPHFAVTVGAMYALFGWLMHTNARLRDSTLAQVLEIERSFAVQLAAFFKLFVATPAPLVLAVAMAAGYCYFAAFTPWWRRILAGLTHTAIQMIIGVGLTILLARYAPLRHSSWMLILWIGICGGFAASVVMGVYLLICVEAFGRHWNEAFSSLRIRHYKNFLRLRIGRDGSLTIFPIGLTTVPRDDKTDPPRNPSLDPHLIEPALTLPPR